MRRPDRLPIARLPRRAERRLRLRTSGFSLLEVILALLVLSIAVAALGELSRLAVRNARIARDKTRAVLLCESKLAEITSGAVLPEPVEGMPLLDVTSPADSLWLYSIALERVDQEGLMAVWVTVYQDLPPEKRPVEFSLVRWILDPMIELPEETATEETEMTTESF